MTETGRIRVEGHVEPGGRLTLAGEAFDALMLWGARTGQALTITGPAGRLYRARLAGLDGKSAVMDVFEDAGPEGPEVDILLIQALPEKERMELIIEKAAELGAAAVMPVKSTRSISLEQRDSPQKKSHRWPEVALKAGFQSRSPFITRVLAYQSLEAAVESAEAQGCQLKIALWERPGLTALREVLTTAREKKARSAAILAGPEGGFTETEMERAARSGFVPVSLGSRILRTETAAITAIALARYELCGR